MRSNNNPGPDNKKKFPGGFLLFILAGILIFMTVQNLSSEKKAKVSFTHQIEHLVNLNLINPSDSRKIALNDNLVTFSGRFKESLTGESEERYRYLELLNSNHQLSESRQTLASDLDKIETNVKNSADYYLHLSGIGVPAGGYRVVDTTYDTSLRQNSIILKSLSSRDAINLPQVEALMDRAKGAGNSDAVAHFGSKLHALIQNYRSPLLGIGNETMKAQLKELDESVKTALENDSLSAREAMTTYAPALHDLQVISITLNQEVNHARLVQLRSVRNYLEYLQQYNYVASELEKNTAQLDKARTYVAGMTWFFNNKELSTKSLEKQNPEKFSHWFAQAKTEWENYASNSGAVFKAPDQPRTAVLEKTFQSQEPSPNYLSYLFTVLPVLFLLFVLYFVFSRQMKGAGAGAMNFGKSPARMLNKSNLKVTFKDVAGVEEAKEELSEIVDFLKDPAKFTALGARIPKGVLCIGPPGTGKTLIAKAVAGEADRPFFSISGSDFVEMFVGVGASRIRDLFEQAKKNAPCIIFIDEIDAVGRHRGAGIGGGHDEREQTLNQLLVEMDGFDTNEGVILIAATNRPDVLDKALLRPGRFDRRIVLDLPDVKGRFEILQVHAKKIKIDDTVELMDVARATPGASGADLMNILNEAALLAARRGRRAVTKVEAREACDKVRFGKERRSLELDEKEKLLTAYHESGHAIVALVVEHSDPVEKVTIIPRGLSLGATHFLPKKNRVTYWKKELLDQLAVAMGGRVAEEIFVGDISSGAQGDIVQATQLARSMVCKWGMTELGLVAFEDSESGSYMMPGGSDKNYSDETAQAIDAEVKRLIAEGRQRAVDIIESHRDQMQLMTDMLIEFENLDKQDVLEIIDGTWDVEAKRARMKELEESHRKLPPPPPKEAIKKDTPPPTIDPSPQGA